MKKLIVLYANNPPKAKIERIQGQVESQGKSLVLLPIKFRHCAKVAVNACMEWNRESRLLKKALKSKTSRFFTDAEREDLKLQIQDLENKIWAVMSKVEINI